MSNYSNVHPSAIFRADAGSTVGFGHIVRTAALAAYLRHDFRCTICCRNDVAEAEPFVNSLIEDAGATRLEIETSDRSLESFNKAFLLNLEHDRIVVLDNYYFNRAYQLAARNRSKALVSIDDVPDRKFASDVLFTPSPLCESDFSLELDTMFYGGVEWAFLREPFLEPAAVRTSPRIARVVVAMGGADPFRITDSIVSMVREIDPDVQIDIIAGPATEIDVSEDDSLSIHRHACAEEIAGIFDRADLGIFPASTVTVEAMARKLPVAAGWYADNQRAFYDEGVPEGWFLPLGDLRRCPAELEKSLRGVFENYNPSKVPDFDFRARRKDIIDIFKRLWKQTANA